MDLCVARERLVMKTLPFTVAMMALAGAPLIAGESDDPLLTKGKKAYKSLCSKCHGVDMVNAGTSTYDLRKFPKEQQDRFYNSVNNGKGAMPAWADLLEEGELDALWRYVVTRGGKDPLLSDVQKSDASADQKKNKADG